MCEKQAEGDSEQMLVRMTKQNSSREMYMLTYTRKHKEQFKHRCFRQRVFFGCKKRDRIIKEEGNKEGVEVKQC